MFIRPDNKQGSNIGDVSLEVVIKATQRSATYSLSRYKNNNSIGGQENLMDISKRNEILRKRNAELSKQLEDINSKLESMRNDNSESIKQFKELITELETIKNQWLQSIEEIEDKKTEYEVLIHELKEMKNILVPK